MLKTVYIVAAKRTAFGAFGGSLKNKSAVDLGAVAAKAAVEQIGGGQIVDSVCMGNVAQTTTGTPPNRRPPSPAPPFLPRPASSLSV